VPEGGWFALAIAAGVALIKFGWLTGQTAKKEALQRYEIQLKIPEFQLQRENI
jgi:K+ transporter